MFILVSCHDSPVDSALKPAILAISNEKFVSGFFAVQKFAVRKIKIRGQKNSR